MKYRYALDQTKNKNETLLFLQEIALKYNIVAWGYYKGHSKTETMILKFDGPKHKKVIDMKKGNKNVL